MSDVAAKKETEKEKDDRILGPRQRVRSLVLVVGTAFRADPVRATTLFTISVAGALGGAAAAYALKLFTCLLYTSPSPRD